MIHIDPRVKSKHITWLRRLGGCDLTRLAQEKNVYLVHDCHHEPAVVVVPYELYLKLQQLVEGTNAHAS